MNCVPMVNPSVFWTFSLVMYKMGFQLVYLSVADPLRPNFIVEMVLDWLLYPSYFEGLWNCEHPERPGDFKDCIAGSCLKEKTGNAYGLILVLCWYSYD